MNRSRWAWTAAALALFLASLVTAYAGFAGADWRAEVPVARRAGAAQAAVSPVVRADYRLAVWAVARNAWALTQRPTRLFEAEPCYPTQESLALHHPVVAPALLALPAWWATGDPVATFDFALFASALLAASAMALVVADWTRQPAAGLAAGLLYAFHAGRLAKPHHFFTIDDAWLLLALFFAVRLFRGSRWRDAVGLGLSAGLQTASSFYPFLSAAAIGTPFALWLLWRKRPDAGLAARLALALAIAGALAAWIFLPYLGLEGETLTQRHNVHYAPWSRFAPGGALFPGVTCLLLVAAGLALGRRRALAGLEGDPRIALAVGAGLVALLATGGTMAAQMGVLQGGSPPPLPLPNLFAALAAAVPGLAAVRLPSALAPGVLLVVCLFAGFGAAALLRATPRRWLPAATAALLALVWADALRPAFLGLTPRVRFEALTMRPPQPALDFYARLDRLGNRGPMLELPIDRDDNGYAFNDATLQHLLSAYHHRRTSGCYSSFIPDEVRRLSELSPLTGPQALARARELGFTTVIVHHASERGRRTERRVRREARSSGGRLVPIVRTRERSAYELRDPGAASG